MKVNRFKIYCETDETWEYVLKEDGQSAPTTCPTNAGHTVTSNSVSIEQVIGDTTLSVSNLPLGAATGGVVVSAFKPELFSTTIVSHDWTRKSTWYQKSVRITDEVLTPTGLVYASTHTFWIDLTHGFLFDEDAINVAGAYSVVVKVNDVVVTSGFTVGYAAGTVTFDSDPGAEVKATYSYATLSTYTITPTASKVLLVEHVELQFAKNMQMDNQYIDFEIWAYNPADMPNKIMVQRSRYKNMRDIINSSNLGQGLIPAMDTLTQDVVVFPFNYASLKPLKYSQGLEIRIKTSDDQPLSGEWGTCTFYTYVRAE
jgi:hypothetical protein